MTSQSLSDEERLEIGARIAELEIEHQDLDDVIARLAEHSSQDQLQLQRLKKRKLVLKDSTVAILESIVPSFALNVKLSGPL